MTPNASGRPNRVAPDGSTHAVADRGLFWGNRGRLLTARGEVARHHCGRNWIVCVLSFHGRHRTQWQPDRLTELYFVDEPTALAAGHRPCGECRYRDYQRFRAAWEIAHPDDEPGAREIDRRLHADRLDADGRHRTHPRAARRPPRRRGARPRGRVLAGRRCRAVPLVVRRLRRRGAAVGVPGRRHRPHPAVDRRDVGGRLPVHSVRQHAFRPPPERP